MEQNLNWLHIPYYSYIMHITGDSGSEETNTLLTLIPSRYYILVCFPKIHMERKNKLLINKFRLK